MIDLGQLELLAVAAWLLAGCYGWGLAGTLLAGRLGWRSAPNTVGPALQSAIGLGCLTALGGVLVACHAGYPDVLGAELTVGVVAAGWGTRRRLLGRVRGVRLVGVLGAIGGLVIALISCAFMLGTVATFFYNINDDDPGYVYLAQRIVSTGALIDPFSFRRVSDYGGASYFQALFLHFSGNDSLQAFDEVFAAALLILLAATGPKRALKLLGAALVALVVLIGHGVGPLINLSPGFIGAALSLAVYQLCCRARAEQGRARTVAFSVVGLMLGALLAIRTTYLGPAAIVTLVALGGRPSRANLRRALRCGLGLLAGGFVAMVGWSIALEESSSTPLFPLIPGNYTGQPGSADPSVSAVSAIENLGREVAASGQMEWVALVTIVIGLGLFVFRRRDRDQAVLVSVAGAACLLNLAMNAVLFSGFAVLDLWRYDAPCVLGAGLFAIDQLWGLGRADAGVPRQVALSRRSARTLFGALGASAGVIVLLALIGDWSLPNWSAEAHQTLHAWRSAAEIPGVVNRYSSAEAEEYAFVNALLPSGAHVLAAVDVPGLLDLAKFDVATIDLPGGSSPVPHMPFFQGSAAQIAYLEREGFSYVVMSNQNDYGFYFRDQWVASLTQPPWYAEAIALYMVDWLDTENALLADPVYAKSTVGQLTVVRLR